MQSNKCIVHIFVEVSLKPSRSKKKGRTFSRSRTRSFFISPEWSLPRRRSLPKKITADRAAVRRRPRRVPPCRLGPSVGSHVCTASARAFTPPGRAGRSRRFPARVGTARLARTGRPAWPCRRAARGYSAHAQICFDLFFQDCRGETSHSTSVVAQLRYYQQCLHLFLQIIIDFVL
jgi:hypothetical protein